MSCLVRPVVLRFAALPRRTLCLRVAFCSHLALACGSATNFTADVRSRWDDNRKRGEGGSASRLAAVSARQHGGSKQNSDMRYMGPWVVRECTWSNGHVHPWSNGF